LSTNIFCLSARNRKRKNFKRLGCVQPKSSSAWHTRLFGAPGWTPVKRPLSGKVQWRTTIIHRTVRWCTGLSGEPTVANATVGRAIRGRRVARANGQQGAPDCPVCTGQCPVRQLPRSCNGHLRQKRKEIGTGPYTVTVRWRTRLSGVHRTVSGAPTAPELQRSSAPEKEGDRHRTIYSDCPVAHQTVRCATRQKARMTFLVSLQRLLAALGL
jgi:hypothetical protein